MKLVAQVAVVVITLFHLIRQGSSVHAAAAVVTVTASSSLSWIWNPLDRSANVSPSSNLPSAQQRELEFGDFAEIPEDCPATTSCPVVCVAIEGDCPTSCEPGTTLCLTGNCLTDCSVHDANVLDATYSTPCACDTLPVACAKVVQTLDACATQFQTYYNASSQCVQALEESQPRLSTTGPWFVLVAVEFLATTFLTIGWCFYNQKMDPRADSIQPMPTAKSVTNSEWTQTGYRTHVIGTFIYLMVTLTFWIFQFLLFLLTIFYYMQQGAITRWAPVFQNEVQVLKVFEIVWMVGIVWCLAFRYPSTGIRELFLRRCHPSQATHIAISAPVKSIALVSDASGNMSSVVGLSAMMWYPIDLTLRTIFSHPYDLPGLDTIFCRVERDALTGTRSILHRMRRYVYDETTGGFAPAVFSVGTTIGDLMTQVNGLSHDTVLERQGLTGPNVIPLQRPTVWGSLYKEFSKTFYVYQNFMVWTWANFFYYYMAIVNTVVRLTGGLVVAYFQHSSDCLLYQLSSVQGEIEVLRGGSFQIVPVSEAVPGDVVALKIGTVHCDMVILKGSRILMDESALTGESTPVQKVEFDSNMSNEAYSPSLHKLHSISTGTEILDMDNSSSNLGLVMTTGSYTSKGELLTEVLSYQRHKFQFDYEVMLVLCILAVEAIVLVWLAFLFLDDNWVFSWFYGVFILGTIIPPLLPTVFVVSVGISAKRLQSKRISCARPDDILVAGKVDAAFFDKTGTMTKQGMDFLSFECDKSMSDKVNLGMAVCHTLSTTSAGVIVGNQVDKVSFESTGATLKSKHGDSPQVSLGGKDYTVVKQFEFDCRRATQSVVVESSDGGRQIIVKGSPEAIKALCNHSSLPDGFDATVNETAKSGIYQIGMGFRDFDLDKKLSEVQRDDLEKSLTFGALIFFQNLLRDETAGVLQELAEGGVATAMITGDSVLTGICIARESGMINPKHSVILGRSISDTEVEWVEFDNDAVVESPSVEALAGPKNKVDLAITGEAWTLLCESDPKYASILAKYIRVFGRCKPEDKVSVVANFVANGYKTLMCGDGQNDCGSLKTAHVGIALSSAEASVVAPFTSLDKSFTSVTEVLKEGRCALASALSAYSYYIIYGQTESFLQVINAFLSITFTEWCWVFLDGIWSISMAFSLPLAKASDRLTPRRPTDSLLGPETTLSVCGILCWNFFFLVLALITLFQQDWFQCRKWNSDDVSNVLAIGDNYEASVLFIIGGFQYISSAMVLNFGYTFRQSWFKNYVFVLLALTWTAFIFVMTIYPSSFSCIWRVNCDNENAVRWVTTTYPVAIINPFNTTVMPVHFRWMLVMIMGLNFLTVLSWQYFFVNGVVVRKANTARLELNYSTGTVPGID